jgi:hypothetical protein
MLDRCEPGSIFALESHPAKRCGIVVASRSVPGHVAEELPLMIDLLLEFLLNDVRQSFEVLLGALRKIVCRCHGLQEG